MECIPRHDALSVFITAVTSLDDAMSRQPTVPALRLAEVRSRRAEVNSHVAEVDSWLTEVGQRVAEVTSRPTEVDTCITEVNSRPTEADAPVAELNSRPGPDRDRTNEGT